MDGAFNLNDTSIPHGSSPKISYRTTSDIYLSGSPTNTLDPSLLERDHNSPSKITAIKTRLKHKPDDRGENFSMAEFPALSGSSGMYSEKLGSFLGFNYQGRPIVSKSSSFKMEKEDFPALPQSHMPDVAEQLDSPRSVLEIASSDPRIDPSESDNFADKFGISGLISRIREERSKVATSFLNRNFLDFGADVSSLDLDVNSKKSLSQQTFSPFFSETAHLKITKSDPGFSVPKCFVKMKVSANGFENLGLQSLFYAFLFFPKDIKQLKAAVELYSRGWKYHRIEKVWLLLQTDDLDTTNPKLVTFDKKSMKKTLYTGSIVISQFTSSDDFLSKDILNKFLRNHIKT